MNWTIERHEVLPSTNDLAVERIRAGTAAPGQVIVAAAQTAGHGRRGRRWVDAPGALLFTAVLPAPESHRQWTALTAALAVAAALRAQGVPAGLKWPNDVIVGRRKVAGILAEVPAGGLAAVGIGINVDNPVQELPGAGENATSLVEVLGRKPGVEPVLAAVLDALAAAWPLLTDGRVEQLLDRWRRLDATFGRRVRLLPDRTEGVALGPAADGTLQVGVSEGVLRAALVDAVEFLE
jgi:BirA family biotin operon repressor/biotin-[acetyl-CoA-carboxylase] ligase